jgi:ketosteroid isomerase-like protein
MRHSQDLTTVKVVITPRNGSPSMARAGHTLSILRKQAGRWKIARDASVLARVPQVNNPS